MNIGTSSYQFNVQAGGPLVAIKARKKTSLHCNGHLMASINVPLKQEILEDNSLSFKTRFKIFY